MEIEKELKLKERDELFDNLIQISFFIAEKNIFFIYEKRVDRIFDILTKHFKYYSKNTIIHKLCDRISLENEIKEIFCVGSDSDSSSDSDSDSDSSSDSDSDSSSGSDNESIYQMLERWTKKLHQNAHHIKN